MLQIGHIAIIKGEKYRVARQRNAIDDAIINFHHAHGIHPVRLQIGHIAREVGGADPSPRIESRRELRLGLAVVIHD